MRRKTPPRETPPPLELECLRVLWQIGEGTVHDVREALTGRRELAYTTVMTLLDRLEKKGTVTRVKSGRSFLYAPAVDRETMRQAAVRDLVDAYFDGDADGLRHWLAGAPPAAVDAAPEQAKIDRRLDTELL